jgi:hypothetical protein
MGISRQVNTKIVVAAFIVGIVMSASGAAFAYLDSTGSGSGTARSESVTPLSIEQISPAYDATPSPLSLGSLSGVSQEGGAVDELGNEVDLASTGTLSSIVVTMLSQACQSGNYQEATSNGGCDESTLPGASFSEPVTLTLYNAGADGEVGAEITHLTQTFAIPYLPAFSASCDNVLFPGGGGYTSSTGCEDAINDTVTFDFAPLKVSLSSKQLIYGISYPTSDYGPDPFGHGTPCWETGTDPGCPYDELNVALTTSATEPTVGSDRFPGQLDMSSPIPSEYCDDGAAGSGNFRLDSPGTDPASCSGGDGWSVGGGGAPYELPAVQIDLVADGIGDLYPNAPPQPIDFAITNPNPTDVHVGDITVTANSLGEAGDLPSPTYEACSLVMFPILQGAPIDAEIPPGTTYFVPSGASISMPADGKNQDNCEGATLNLSFESSSA